MKFVIPLALLSASCGGAASAPVEPTLPVVPQTSPHDPTWEALGEVGFNFSAQSPASPPGAWMDLTGWYLTLPVLDRAHGGTTRIDSSELQGGKGRAPFVHPKWFYFDETTRAVVFKTPNFGATTASSNNTRSELRELVRGEDATIGIKDARNNWVLSSHPQASEFGAIGGILSASLAVDWVSTSGDDQKSAAHAVVVGQVHGSGRSEALKIFFRKLPQHERGSLFWSYETRPENEDKRQDVFHIVWGNDALTGADAEPEDGLRLGEKFSYVVEVTGTMMNLTFRKSDGVEVKQSRDLGTGHPDHPNDRGYADEWMYFKAGAYNHCNLGTEGLWGSGCQNRGEAAGDYAQVSFTSIAVEHPAAP